MFTTTTLLSTILFLASPALTQEAGASKPAWHPPTPNDVRSPCPGLNTLANHGYLPRSGRNISLSQFTSAIDLAFNIPASITTIVAQQALALAPAPFTGVAVDLSQLAVHNAIEHDGSLSRADKAVVGEGGDYVSFNQTVFDSVLEYFEGAETVSVKTAAEARFGRIEAARRDSPATFAESYKGSRVHGSYLETVLYLLTMAKADAAAPGGEVVPVEFVKILFEQERIPFLEGWQRRKAPVFPLQVSSLVLQLALTVGEKTTF